MLICLFQIEIINEGSSKHTNDDEDTEDDREPIANQSSSPSRFTKSQLFANPNMEATTIKVNTNVPPPTPTSAKGRRNFLANRRKKSIGNKQMVKKIYWQ